MNIERLTTKVKQAINDSQLVAVRFNHQTIDSIHLFMALVSQEDGLIPNIFSKMGVDIETLKKDIENELGRISTEFFCLCK